MEQPTLTCGDQGKRQVKQKSRVVVVVVLSPSYFVYVWKRMKMCTHVLVKLVKLTWFKQMRANCLDVWYNSSEKLLYKNLML